jgi:RNA polymerase sigma factor (sigma-70 family)
VGGSDSGSPGSERPQSALRRSPDEFPSTVWMRIEKARDAGAPQSGEALAELCEAYWQPVYAFLRRKGNDPDQAADLTQDFFALLIEPGALASVTQGKGKFRSFLMAACAHFLSNRRAYERALKRGGGRRSVSIDQFQAEDRLQLEPFHELTPERIYLRQWAQTLLDRVMARLQSEVSSKGKSNLFDQLKPVLLGREAAPSYSQIATALGVSETAVKVAVHRYRTRYRQLLREEIARTVDDPAEIEEEINTLIQALAE